MEDNNAYKAVLKNLLLLDNIFSNLEGGRIREMRLVCKLWNERILDTFHKYLVLSLYAEGPSDILHETFKIKCHCNRQMPLGIPCVLEKGSAADDDEPALCINCILPIPELETQLKCVNERMLSTISVCDEEKVCFRTGRRCSDFSYFPWGMRIFQYAVGAVCKLQARVPLRNLSLQTVTDNWLDYFIEVSRIGMFQRLEELLIRVGNTFSIGWTAKTIDQHALPNLKTLTLWSQPYYWKRDHKRNEFDSDVLAETLQSFVSAASNVTSLDVSQVVNIMELKNLKKLRIDDEYWKISNEDIANMLQSVKKQLLDLALMVNPPQPLDLPVFLKVTRLAISARNLARKRKFHQPDWALFPKLQKFELWICSESLRSKDFEEIWTILLPIPQRVQEFTVSNLSREQNTSSALQLILGLSVPKLIVKFRSYYFTFSDVATILTSRAMVLVPQEGEGRFVLVFRGGDEDEKEEDDEASDRDDDSSSNDDDESDEENEDDDGNAEDHDDGQEQPEQPVLEEDDVEKYTRLKEKLSKRWDLVVFENFGAGPNSFTLDRVGARKHKRFADVGTSACVVTVDACTQTVQ